MKLYSAGILGLIAKIMWSDVILPNVMDFIQVELRIIGVILKQWVTENYWSCFETMDQLFPFETRGVLDFIFKQFLVLQYKM